MADLEKQLKDDAAAIRADVSPELAARISASVHAAVREPEKTASRRSGSLWWMSSLTGVAAALLILVLLGRDDLATLESMETSPEGSTAANTTAPPARIVPRLRHP